MVLVHCCYKILAKQILHIVGEWSNRHRLCHGILSVFPIDITKSK